MWSRAGGRGSPDEARLEQTPYPFTTQLIWRYLGIKQHYRFNHGGSYYCRGAQLGAGGWAPPGPLTLTADVQHVGDWHTLPWRLVVNVFVTRDASLAGCRVSRFSSTVLAGMQFLSHVGWPQIMCGIPINTPAPSMLYINCFSMDVDLLTLASGEWSSDELLHLSFFPQILQLIPLLLLVFRFCSTDLYSGSLQVSWVPKGLRSKTGARCFTGWMLFLSLDR